MFAGHPPAGRLPRLCSCWRQSALHPGHNRGPLWALQRRAFVFFIKKQFQDVERKVYPELRSRTSLGKREGAVSLLLVGSQPR